MSTLKQIQAKRLKATKSIGPRTAEGKSANRFNAHKYGLFAESTIIKGEDAAAFDALRDSYGLRWEPATPEEDLLVTNLVRYTWLLDRFSRLERRIWNRRLAEPFGQHPVGYAHSLVFKELDSLQRRLNSTQRNYRWDLELLIKLQTDRKKVGRGAPGAAPPREPISEFKSAEPLVPEIGLVPAIPAGAPSKYPPPPVRATFSNSGRKPLPASLLDAA